MWSPASANLSRGDVVILGNLPAHKNAKAAQCLRQKGVWLRPPSCPDLDPIEMGLIKAHLRNVEA